jgi:hypothetical protein
MSGESPGSGQDVEGVALIALALPSGARQLIVIMNYGPTVARNAKVTFDPRWAIARRTRRTRSLSPFLKRRYWDDGPSSRIAHATTSSTLAVSKPRPTKAQRPNETVNELRTVARADTTSIPASVCLVRERRRRDLNPRSREGLLFSRSTQGGSEVVAKVHVRRSGDLDVLGERPRTTVNETLNETPARAVSRRAPRYLSQLLIEGVAVARSGMTDADLYPWPNQNR